MAARQDDGGVIWERPEPPSRPAPSPLSRELIVRAAIDLADADGLEAVSLRKVAAALDAGPMRLYGYLSTKEELLDLMVDAVYGELPLPEASDDWRMPLRARAYGMREAAHRHEWFPGLLGGRPQFGPNALAYMEATYSALDNALDDLDVLFAIVGTVGAYVLGALQIELSDRRAERATGLDERQWQATNGAYLKRMLATGKYPTIGKILREVTHRDADAVFEAGLAHVLDGIAKTF